MRSTQRDIFARSQVTTPRYGSVNSSLMTVAARVVRSVKTVNCVATTVHSHALLRRKQAISRATKATNRGPLCPRGTPSGNGAVVDSPQHRQGKRCRWYSVTCGLISGSSHTWCRSGSESLPSRGWPQRRQGRILWRFVQPAFEFRDPRQKPLNKGPHGRSHLRRNSRRNLIISAS